MRGEGERVSVCGARSGAPLPICRGEMWEGCPTPCGGGGDERLTGGPSWALRGPTQMRCEGVWEGGMRSTAHGVGSP